MASNTANVTALDEWKEVRSLFSRFDNHLYDLRKYGLSIIAALLTTTAIASILALAEFARFALIVLTIALILTMNLLDQNYRQLEKAASVRARILETILNFELSETISESYDRENMKLYIPIVYSGLIVISTLLGVAVLPTNYWLPLVIIALVIPIGLIHLISTNLVADKRRGKDERRNDWIIDKVCCEKGELVKITVTNLGQKVIEHDGCYGVDIIDKEGEIIDKLRIKNKNGKIRIPINDNYSWLWDTNPPKIKGNEIYRVQPTNSDHPIRRSITVLGSVPKSDVILSPPKTPLELDKGDLGP